MQILLTIYEMIVKIMLRYSKHFIQRKEECEMSKIKKVIAVLLAIVIVCGTLTVFADSGKAPIAVSPSGTYQAEKISHKDAGLREVDGLIEYDSGENDRGQSYSWSAVGYGDYVYVGTCYAAIWQTLKIMSRTFGISVDAIKTVMNTAFNGTLYLGDTENNPEDLNRSVIVKIHAKTGETEIVVAPVLTPAGGYRAATVFNNKLYFVSAGSTPSLLEIDPATDESKTVYQCEKITNPLISTGIRAIAAINGKLALSTISENGASIVASENPSAGQDSFKTIATQEDLLDYPAYHYTDAIFGGSIWDMIAFNGKLYITVVTGKGNVKQSFALFCGEEQADGTWKYHLLAGAEEDGAKYPFGLGADRSGAANLMVYDNHLYIGGYNDPMVALPAAISLDFEAIYSDLSAPVNLWRMDADENFEMVIGEPNEYFSEVKGNMGAGFDNNLNQYVWRMEVYNDKLFVGTFDIGSLAYPLMQFTNGDLLDRSWEEWKTQIKYLKELIDLIKDGGITLPRSAATSVATLSADVASLEDLFNKGGIDDLVNTQKFYEILTKLNDVYAKISKYLPEEIKKYLDPLFNQDTLDNIYYFIETCKYLSKGERGFDLFVTEDGYNFETITRNGFGDPYNHGCRVFAVTDLGLCLGTANPFYGTQVWRIDDLSATEPTDPTDPGTTEPTDPVDPTDPDTTEPSTDDTTAPTDPSDSTEPTDDTAVPSEPDTSDSTGGNTDGSTQTPGLGDVGVGFGVALLVTATAAVVITRKKRK